MKPPLCILCTLATFLICVNTATIPTEDQTIVVAKADDDDVSEATATSEMATEEPNAPIKLTEMLVQSEVSLRYAHTAVVTHVRNPARRSQEASFHVLLPDTAFITGFVMTLSGKSYKAYVKEKEEAKKIYSDAVSQGIGAAHVAAKARNSNHFTVTVNVEPNSKATFNLTYEELLVRRNGVYNHAINLHPGALVPHMEVRVHIKESQKIKLLRVPELRTGNEIDATESDAQNTVAVIKKSDDKKEATITFTPDLEEQKRLARVFADNLKKTQSHHWYSNVDEDNNNEGGIGQFVVQYDVERPDKGEILVNDGYFVHFFAPQSLSPLSKYVIFVLDTSGSMGGRKIEQLRAAMRAILADLNPNDYFSIVEFNSDVQVHELKEADEPEKPRSYSYHSWRSESKPVVLVPPSHASPENIAKAQIIVSRLSASGGTNIYDALKVALDLIHKAYANNNSDSSNKEIQSADISDLEPTIIFLTDGDPTVGETSTQRIISHMTEKNSGQKKAAIFSLAFGEDADRTFLRKLSLRNDGFMRHIYEAADAELQLRHFYQQVSSPLLAGVHFVYPPNQIKEGSVTKNKYKAIYDGSEIVVAGQLGSGVIELEPTVQAFCADPHDHRKKPYEVRPALTSGPAGEFLPLERMWAYLSVKQLLDEREVLDSPKDVEKRALDIALKYAFVTPLTSLVVVKPNATDAVNAESVDNNNKPSFGSFLQSPSFASYPAHIGIPAPANMPVHYSISGGISLSEAAQSFVVDEEEDYAGRPLTGYGNAVPLSLGAGAPIRSFSSPMSPRFDVVTADARVNYQMMGNNDRISGGSFRISGGPSSSYDYDTSDSNPPLTLHIIGGESDRTLITGGMSNIFGGASNGNIISGGMSNSYPLRNRYHNFHGGRPYYHHGLQGQSGDRILGGHTFNDRFVPDSYFVSTPATPSPPPPSTTEQPLEHKYHLEGFTWALSLLNGDAGSLEFSSNGKNVTLEVSKDSNPPKASNGDEECSNVVVSKQKREVSSEGAGGVCVYLTRCAAAADLVVDAYLNTYCTVNNRYAGVCCPRNQVDVRKA